MSLRDNRRRPEPSQEVAELLQQEKPVPIEIRKPREAPIVKEPVTLALPIGEVTAPSSPQPDGTHEVQHTLAPRKGFYGKLVVAFGAFHGFAVMAVEGALVTTVQQNNLSWIVQGKLGGNFRGCIMAWEGVVDGPDFSGRWRELSHTEGIEITKRRGSEILVHVVVPEKA